MTIHETFNVNKHSIFVIQCLLTLKVNRIKNISTSCPILNMIYDINLSVAITCNILM